jgi:hypothetical protein
MESIKNRFRILKAIIYCLLFIASKSICAQDTTSSKGLFEGKVTYLYQILNPNKGLISDEEFYRDMPNEGKSFSTLTIKGSQYKWEYEDRSEIYLPKLNQIAIKSKNSNDSTYFAYANLAEEPLIKIEKSDQTKKIKNYNLTAYTAESKWDSKTFYYSPLMLKTNPNFWKNHKRDYLGDFITKSSSFPMMIVVKSLLGNYVMAMTKVEPMTINEEEFELKK